MLLFGKICVIMDKKKSLWAVTQERTFLMHLYSTPKDYDCQVQKILQKAQIKKAYNSRIVQYFESIGDFQRAQKIADCGSFIGITRQDERPKIVKANFCRDRLCNICAWRRQSKFVAQMSPVLQLLSKDFEFLFVTLTAPNVSPAELETSLTLLLRAFSKLTKRRPIARAFCGICRSLEITYNAESGTFHPHIHLLVAVRRSYFTESNLYISQKELADIWRECLGLSFTPVVDIRKVSDVGGVELEVLKYAFKTPKDVAVFGVLSSALRGRRLVSFTGVFAQLRKKLKLSSFEDNLLDDYTPQGHKICYELYKFDVTGGVYSFYERLEYEV